MRLIDADARIDDLMERYCKDCDKRKGMKNGKRQFIYEIGEVPCRACEVDDVKAELEEAPTIEPKKGKWVSKIENGNIALIECSECRFEYPMLLAHRFRYCPNCGAKMDEVEDV